MAYGAGEINGMISISCASCGSQLTAPDDAVGKTIACSHCGHVNVVPPASSTSRPADHSLDFVLAPDESPAAAAAGTVSPATAPEYAPPQRKPRYFKDQPRRWPAIVILIFLASAGLAAYFGWDLVWERLNTKTIYDMRVDGDAHYLHHEYQAALNDYNRILQLVGSRHIHNTKLSEQVELARQGKARADPILAANRPDVAPTTQATRLNLVGNVVLLLPQKPSQPLGNLKIYVLKPYVSRSVMVSFYQDLQRKALQEESAQLRRADALRKEASQPFGPGAAEAQKEIAEDLIRAKTLRDYATAVDRRLAQLNDYDDLVAVRREMIDAEHKYRIAAGQSFTGTASDLSKEILGWDYNNVVRAAFVAETTTDSSGRYMFKDLPARAGVSPEQAQDQYYVYAYWQSGVQQVEWLVRLPTLVPPEFQCDLGFNNTIAAKP